MARRKKRRALDEESDKPLSEETKSRMGAAARAYRCSVYGLIPGLGLVLGPVAVALGLRARLKERNDPDSRDKGLAGVTVLLGIALTVTNWVGLVLMILGLRQ